MRNELFCGCGTALITPFRNGSVDYAALESLIDDQLRAGIDALILLGTTGEPSTLSEAERARAIETGIEKCAGQIPVYVGVGSNDTRHAVKLSADAQNRGADGLLVVTPYYNLANADGLLAHYRAIADSVRIPIIVYNVPSRTGVNMPPEIMAELAKHPLLCAFKEACADIGHAMRVLELTDGGVSVYAGNDDQTLPLTALGARGVISVASNVVPKEMLSLTRACLRGDFSEARRLHFHLLPLLRALKTEVNPIPVKTALHLLGKCDNELRLPLTSMNPERIRDTLAQYK